MSPPIKVRSPELAEIDAAAAPLEIELDRLRETSPFNRPQHIQDRIRALRRILSAADAQARQILWRDNPDYFNYWFGKEAGAA